MMKAQIVQLQAEMKELKETTVPKISIEVIAKNVQEKINNFDTRFDKLDAFMTLLIKSPLLASISNVPGTQSSAHELMDTINQLEVNTLLPSPLLSLNLPDLPWEKEMDDHDTT